MQFPFALALTAGLLVAPTATTLQIVPDSSTQEVDGQEHTVLHGSMEILKRGQRGLRKLIADPVGNKGAIMDTLTAMEGAVVVALGQLPPQHQGVSEADLALWHVGYKRTMTSLLESVLAMEDATLRADAEALGVAYKELGQVKLAGHENYRDLK